MLQIRSVSNVLVTIVKILCFENQLFIILCLQKTKQPSGCFFIKSAFKSKNMALNGIRCSKCVSDCVELVKYGNTKSGNQRYRCKICNKIRVRN